MLPVGTALSRLCPPYALARAIVALSQLALSADPLVMEAEINPLIVRGAGEGVLAVDALVKIAKKG